MAVSRNIRLVRGLSVTRTPTSGHTISRHFTNSVPRPLNPLLNLSAFSGSKEAQYFSKERRIPRIEFAPHLELIRASEVDPFAPVAGASPTVIAALRRAQRGESDMQTAYSLAITNLVSQLESSRQELRRANVALDKLHDRYQKQERQGVFIALFTVMILSLIATKTDVVQEAKDYVRSVVSEWKGYEWQWLGNPPPHKTQPKGRLLELPIASTTSTGLYVQPLETARETPVIEQQTVYESQPLTKPSLISRMFWSSSV